MPKMKPNKGIAKRVRVTRNGKVLAKGCGSSHRKVRKSPKRNRMLRQIRPLEESAAKAIRKLLCK